MKFKLWGTVFRAVIMLAALGGVIYTIKVLNTNGINKEALFLNNEPPISPGLDFDLCKTRVDSVYLRTENKEYAVRITGKSWKANEKDLPSVEMEKWLVLLCRVKAEKIINLENSVRKFTFPDTIKFHYVNGESLEFNIENQAFKLNDKAFYSKSFLEMVNNLKVMLSNP